MSLGEKFLEGLKNVGEGIETGIKQAIDQAAASADGSRQSIPTPGFQQIKTDLARRLTAKGAHQAACLVAVEGEAIVEAVAETLQGLKEATDPQPDGDSESA